MVVRPIGEPAKVLLLENGDFAEPRTKGPDEQLHKNWSPAARAALKRRVLEEMPRWYNPIAHFAFPAIVGLTTIVLCVLGVHRLRTVELLTIPITFLLSNAIEWHAHKKLLHKRHWLAPILYERHTPIHHQLYVEGDMALSDWRELRNILLPSFGVLAILSLQLPLLGLALLFEYRNIALLFMATSMAYVLLYEWLHMSYHLPETSFIGRQPIIRVLRRHHARHHDPKLMQKWNMNVTVPLWDWLSGTIHKE